MSNVEGSRRYKVTISIPKELRERGLKEAEKFGVSFSGLVSMALFFFFENSSLTNTMSDLLEMLKYFQSISLEPSRYDSKGKQQGEALNLLDVLSKNLNSDEKESEGR